MRELVRAESRAETGQKVGPTALVVLANIDAMQLAVHAATHVEVFTVDQTGVLLSVMRTPRGRRCMRQMRQRALRFLVVRRLQIARLKVATATTHHKAPLP